MKIDRFIVRPHTNSNAIAQPNPIIELCVKLFLSFLSLSSFMFVIVSKWHSSSVCSVPDTLQPNFAVEYNDIYV